MASNTRSDHASHEILNIIIVVLKKLTLDEHVLSFGFMNVCIMHNDNRLYRTFSSSGREELKFC